MNDNDPLHRLLERWTFEPKVSGQFRANVWARIRERQEEREFLGWRGFLHWLFPSPVMLRLATVTAVLMLAVGALVGTQVGRVQNEKSQSALAQRYAQMIDPYLQVHREVQ